MDLHLLRWLCAELGWPSDRVAAETAERVTGELQRLLDLPVEAELTEEGEVLFFAVRAVSLLGRKPGSLSLREAREIDPGARVGHEFLVPITTFSPPGFEPPRTYVPRETLLATEAAALLSWLRGRGTEGDRESWVRPQRPSVDIPAHLRCHTVGVVAGRLIHGGLTASQLGKLSDYLREREPSLLVTNAAGWRKRSVFEEEGTRYPAVLGLWAGGIGMVSDVPVGPYPAGRWLEALGLSRDIPDEVWSWVKREFGSTCGPNALHLVGTEGAAVVSGICEALPSGADDEAWDRLSEDDSMHWDRNGRPSPRFAVGGQLIARLEDGVGLSAREFSVPTDADWLYIIQRISAPDAAERDDDGRRLSLSRLEFPPEPAVELELWRPPSWSPLMGVFLKLGDQLAAGTLESTIPTLEQSVDAARELRPMRSGESGLSPALSNVDRDSLLAALGEACGGAVASSLEEWFGLHNGDRARPSFGSYRAMSLQEVVETHKLLVDLPHGQPFDPSWVPLFANDGGDYVCADSRGAGQLYYRNHENAEDDYDYVEATDLLAYVAAGVADEVVCLAQDGLLGWRFDFRGIALGRVSRFSAERAMWRAAPTGTVVVVREGRGDSAERWRASVCFHGSAARSSLFPGDAPPRDPRWASRTAGGRADAIRELQLATEGEGAFGLRYRGGTVYPFMRRVPKEYEIWVGFGAPEPRVRS